MKQIRSNFWAYELVGNHAGSFQFSTFVSGIQEKDIGSFQSISLGVFTILKRIVMRQQIIVVWRRLFYILAESYTWGVEQKFLA